MSKINIFIPYFGKFPNYFQLYLDSVGINDDILNVHIITDIDYTDYESPSNVSYIHMTQDEIRSRLQYFISVEYNLYFPLEQLIQVPYKLCDLRPIFFSLFHKELSNLNLNENDYIGWGDCDLIYGRLSNFIDLSKGYHLLGIHGHFTAFRNINQFKFLFQKIDNLPKLLTDDAHYLIDERDFRSLLFDLVNTNRFYCFYMDQFFCDIQPWQYKSDKSMDLEMVGRETKIEFLRFDRLSKSLDVYFIDGSLLSVTYVHLQKRAMKISFNDYLSEFFIYSQSFESSRLA